MLTDKTKALVLFPLYLLSFIEGGAVMAIELVSAKIIAPFYGNSIDVWTIVLAVTLLGLSLGYYCGGLISLKQNAKQKLLIIGTLLSFYILLTPKIASFVLSLTLDLVPKAGIIVSTLFFLFPSLFGLGLLSPIIISILNNETKLAGKTSGLVLAISTIGGIVFTFAYGFWVLPYLGTKVACYSIAVLLLLFSMFLLVSIKQKTILFFVFAALLLLQIQKKSTEHSVTNQYIQVKYKNTSVLGQLLIADDLISNTRSLLVNNVSQSFMSLNTNESVWKYVQRIASLCSVKKQKRKTLLIGMGAGLLAKKLIEQDQEVDIVDIDHRMYDVAKAFFSFNIDKKVIIDDARHYIKTCKKKYDIVILDISFAENQPSHVYTQEGFNEIKQLLNPNGWLFVHFPGILTGEYGKSILSVGKTLSYCNFTIDVLNSNQKEDALSEYIYLARLEKPFYLNQQDTFRLRPYFSANSKTFSVFLNKELPYNDGEILKDEFPKLDELHKKNIQKYREESINIIVKTLIKQGYEIL